MVELKIYYSELSNKCGKEYPVYNINLIHKVNLIVGLSGSGKTFLFDKLTEIKMEPLSTWSLRCNVDIKLISETSIDYFENTVLNNCNCLIVIDEDVVDRLRREGRLKIIEKSKNYFLLLDRTSTIKISANVNSIYELTSRKVEGYRVFDLIPSLSRDSIKNDKIDNIDVDILVSEDSKSGLIFWKNILLKLYLPKFKRHGSGEVPKQIKYLLKKYEGNILVVLDYDRGARIMRSIKINKKIDNSRLYFMPLESFEEVICNSEFILSKYPQIRDAVINYKDHIDCNFTSTANYFSTLLFNIVKVKSPLKNVGDKNWAKFYEKGMKNFKECFIDDCCKFNTPSCQLFYNGDKKKAMLANKFEIYRKFM